MIFLLRIFEKIESERGLNIFTWQQSLAELE